MVVITVEKILGKFEAKLSDILNAPKNIRRSLDDMNSKQDLEESDAELVAVIHDEVIVQTPPPFADRVRGIVEQAMIDGMQTFVSSVPITEEAVVGRSWAEK